MTLDNFIAYLQHEKRSSRHTIISYKSDLLQFAVFCSDAFELADISRAQPLMIREWLAELKSNNTDNRSINRKLSSLRAFYRFCKLQDEHFQSPAEGIASLKTKTRTALFVPEKDMTLRRESTGNFEDFRNLLIVEMLYQTGMRKSELRNLTTSQIDLSRKTVSIAGKGNKQRIVPLTPALIQLIHQYLKYRGTISAASSVFFVSKSGKPISSTTLHNIVSRELSAVTTLEKRSPHVLRHTFATHLLNNGAPLIAVKELLGHSSLAATQVYTHNTIAQLKKIHQQAHPKG